MELFTTLYLNDEEVVEILQKVVINNKDLLIKKLETMLTDSVRKTINTAKQKRKEASEQEKLQHAMDDLVLVDELSKIFTEEMEQIQNLIKQIGTLSREGTSEQELYIKIQRIKNQFHIWKK